VIWGVVLISAPQAGGGRQGFTIIGSNFLEPVSVLTWPKTRQNMPTQSAPPPDREPQTPPTTSNRTGPVSG
jgi:hypothetical protein